MKNVDIFAIFFFIVFRLYKKTGYEFSIFDLPKKQSAFTRRSFEILVEDLVLKKSSYTGTKKKVNIHKLFLLKIASLNINAKKKTH